MTEQKWLSAERKAGLKESSGRYALCSLPFFVCVNLRESAVSFLKNCQEDALRHALSALLA